ncbi:MAG: hypothetical protein OXC57_08750 [Rhodobacteraceae bacterium]|nr:hypothetical protein [Paracoccaceae bacterium]
MLTIVPSDGFTPNGPDRVRAMPDRCSDTLRKHGPGFPLAMRTDTRVGNMIHNNQGDGAVRSRTRRVSTLTDIPSSRVCPQWLPLEGKWFTT